MKAVLMTSRKRKLESFCNAKTKKKKKEFPIERRRSLAESDLGSYYNQEVLLQDDGVSHTCSASYRKLMEASESKPDLTRATRAEGQDGGDNDCDDLISPGRTIVDGQLLQASLEKSVSCRSCGSDVRLMEKISNRHGLGSQWIIVCENESCPGQFTSKPFHTSQKSNRMYDINRLSVLGMRAIGRGHSAAEKLFSIMGLSSPVSHTRWAEHSKVIEEKAKELAQEELQEAAQEVKESLKKDQSKPFADAGTTFDGSWCSRGWSATDACVAAISVDTGKVVDVIHMNSSCSECKKMESAREVTKEEYLDWFLNHEPTCYLNHEGSSSAMEASGAVHLYQRSQERGLRYIPFIGDGDSKAYSDICQAQPYGPAVFIPKEECIAHVTKRMGTALRGLTKEYKGKKLSDGKGIGGSGRLTLKRIDTIQNFYGRAIRDNKGSAKDMSKATHAILKHYSSTPESPKHEDCPKGSDSWCSYQRDKANGTSLHKPIKNPLCPAIVEVIQPIFDRLGDEHFLSGCEKCVTQNVNESLHHLIWSYAPKEMSNSATEISTAISMGVIQFNRGYVHTFSNLLSGWGIEVTTPMLKAWQKIDGERIYLAEYRHSDTIKRRRKQKKKSKLQREDAFVHVEGTTYKSQAFHQGESKKKRGKGSQGKEAAKASRNPKKKAGTARVEGKHIAKVKRTKEKRKPATRSQKTGKKT